MIELLGLYHSVLLSGLNIPDSGPAGQARDLASYRMKMVEVCIFEYRVAGENAGRTAGIKKSLVVSDARTGGSVIGEVIEALRSVPYVVQLDGGPGAEPDAQIVKDGRTVDGG